MNVAASFALVLVLAACTAPAAAPSASDGSPSAEPTAAPTQDLPRVDLYAPLFRRLAHESGWGRPLERLFVRQTLCIPADPPFSDEDRCVDAFTTAEQEALLARLAGAADRVIFVDEGIGAVPVGRGLVVWAGPAQPRGDRTRIDGGSWCGGLCGQGGTYVLVRDGDAWVVDGLAPGAMSWIL